MATSDQIDEAANASRHKKVLDDKNVGSFELNRSFPRMKVALARVEMKKQLARGVLRDRKEHDLFLEMMGLRITDITGLHVEM